MYIAIPKEITTGECRVAATPQIIAEWTQLGCTVLMEKNAGSNAQYPDSDYTQVQWIDNPDSLYAQADIILKVHAPLPNETAHCKPGAIVIGLLAPTRHPEHIQALRDRPITSFTMERIPRISRAQAMDALSSQATVSGYKATLLAANLSMRFFPMLTTAAGTIRPSTVVVLGAGVAGLQAIATARRLGAVVYAYDVRSAVKEQVESLGAKMLLANVSAEASGGYARALTDDEQQRQQALLTAALAKADVVISTALIPGKPAPILITQTMVEQMTDGAVIVDAAAETGGNCALTQPNQIISHHGVRIYGPTNIPSMLARDASALYAKNLSNFLKLIVKNGAVAIDWDDPILATSLLTHDHTIKEIP